MRSVFLGLLLIGAGSLRAQHPVKDNIFRRGIDSLRYDINLMYFQMDTMNHYFYPLIQHFDSVSGEFNDAGINERLDSLIHIDTLFLNSIKDSLDFQYLRPDAGRSKPGKPAYDSTYFYYKTHKEIEDFKYSIELLENSMEHLLVDTLISTIASVRFLNSYYYMSTCRSLLLARMDNLETEGILTREYVPLRDTVKHLIAYPRYRVLNPNGDENQNKITMASDELMSQIRHGPRNWFLKTTAGGATGALIVYVLASLIRGHK